MKRPRIALLSNPKSTGNLAQLPRIREYCAEHPDIFHYEVEHAHQIGEAIQTIARVRPKVLAINGGDGTVQAALTGHLVFTTVHANNVVDVIGRFLNMGLEPYNFVSALNCILAQRLVRKICPHCRYSVKMQRSVLDDSTRDIAVQAAGCLITAVLEFATCVQHREDVARMAAVGGRATRDRRAVCRQRW